MSKPTQDEIKSQIQNYYKSHLSSGLKCEVKNVSLPEAGGDGAGSVKATISFRNNTSGNAQDNKVLIPCDESGNLDWTNVKFLDDTHSVDPSKTSHPPVKSPQPLPANNKKPDTKANLPGEKVTYIQKPEKVGAQGGKKVKGESRKTIQPPKRLGFDNFGWPTTDQLELEEKQIERQRMVRDGYVHGEDEWLDEDLTPAPENSMLDEGDGDDFDVFKEAGIDPVVAQQAMAAKLVESPEGYVHGQDLLEEDMKGFAPKAVNGEDISLALVEYRSKSQAGGIALYEFGVLFESQELRDEAKVAIESVDGVEGVELIEDIGIAVVCRQDEDHDDASKPLGFIQEALGLRLAWDDGHKEKYLAEAGTGSTHNYNDNSGQYSNAVKTDANEPGAPNPNAGADSPTGEEGGPKKRKHPKTSGDQGGDGLGGAKSISTPSVKPDGKEATKQAGQQAEALEEQDFLDDVMSYEDSGAEDGDEMGDDDMAGEEEVGGEVDDTIASLVAAMAEEGLEVVLKVAREQMGELSPEQEEEIRTLYVDAAEGATGGEDEMEVDVTAVSIDGEDEDDDEAGGPPWESQEEDVNINISDGTSEAAPEPETVATEAPTQEMNAAAEPIEEPEAPADDSSESEPSEKPEDGEKDEEEDGDKPSEKEALETLRDQLINELVEMDEVDAIFAVEALDKAQLLTLDEALPPPGEGGRFKKLKKELGGKGAKDPAALASWIGRKKYGKGKFQKMATAGESKKPEEKQKVEEEGGLSGQSSTVTGWAADQPAPNQPLSFVGNDAYSFAQRIAIKDPQVRTAKVLKPGKFSKTTSRHANMVANRLARQGYNVERIDAFDQDPMMKVGELDNQMGLGLPEESLIKLSSARFKKEAIEKLTDEQKSQFKEKLIARANKISEDQQNQNTYGGTQTVQRVQGKNKAYNMFGRLKPGVKWKGLVRVVWDDGNESWEKASDLKNVGANPYNVKSPAGAAAKPGSQSMSKAGGEELAMLKNIESLKKLPRNRRFDKAVALQAEGKKLDVDKLVPILTEGWDEFEEFDVDSLVEAMKPEPVPAPEPERAIEESEEDDDEFEEFNMLTEDFGIDGE